MDDNFWSPVGNAVYLTVQTCIPLQTVYGKLWQCVSLTRWYLALIAGIPQHILHSLITGKVECAEFLLLSNCFSVPLVFQLDPRVWPMWMLTCECNCSLQDLKANESRLKDINKVANDLESEGLMAEEVQAVEHQVCLFSWLSLILLRSKIFPSFL